MRGAGLVAWLVFGLLGWGLLTGCQAAAPSAGGGSAPAPASEPDSGAQPTAAIAPQAAPAPVAVTVHNFSNSVNTAIVQHGIEKGFYGAEGLDVALQNADASVGVQLAATGHVQFSTSVGSALAAAVRGVPIKVVFVSAYRPLWWMYAQPSITSVAELRGKRLGLSSAGSSLTIVARLILERYGIGPDDALFLNVASPQRLAALQSGAVDASFLVAPGNLLAAKAGFRELFASHEEGVLLITEGLAAGDEYLRDQPDVVRRMMRASVRSLDAMRSNRAEAVATVARFTEVEREEAEQIYDFALPGWTTNGTADASALRQSIDIMKQVGEVAGPVEESQAFDLRHVREVAAELGVR